MIEGNLLTEDLLSKIEQLVKDRPALINEIRINKDTKLFRQLENLEKRSDDTFFFTGGIKVTTNDTIPKNVIIYIKDDPKQNEIHIFKDDGTVTKLLLKTAEENLFKSLNLTFKKD